jgi:glutaredoxin
MTYSEKLKDPRWQRKRLEIFQRDGFKCSYCNDKDSTLHVHHEQYQGNPWEAPNEALKTACVHCHAVLETLKKKGLQVVKIGKWSGPHKPAVILVITADDGFYVFNIHGEDITMTLNMSYSEVFKFVSPF